MNRIIIADGYTLNPGDLDWSPLDAMGDVEYHDRMAATDIAERLANAHIIITNKTPVTSATMERSPGLKLIAVTATGYNVVDVAAAGLRGVAVCNVPEYGTDSVAQHAFAMLLELTNHVGQNSVSVAKGEWTNAADWSYSRKPMIELQGKTMGIVGLGRIGKRVASIAPAFGLNVIGYNKGKNDDEIKTVPLHELFASSDVISLHCPLTKDNEKFVDRSLLSQMKPTAFLINTARGPLINEHDLANALRDGLLAGAALDVLSKEPPPPDHPLIGVANCLVTPHNAWSSFEARKRLLDTTIDNIRCFLAGDPKNLVNS